MSMGWFRWYHGTVSDPKLALIAKKSNQSRSAVIAVWAALLEHASQSENRGEILNFDAESIAVALDIDDGDVQSILAAMIAKGMIVDHRLSAWEHRQPQREDGAAERAKAWREKQKQFANASERKRTQANAGKRPDADADTDADTESSKQRVVGIAESVGAQAPFATATTDPKPGLRPVKNLPPAPEWLSPDAWNAFIDHRKAKRKPLTPQAAHLTLRDLAKAREYGHDPVELIEAAISAGWTGCVFADKHFIPVEPQTPRTRNGQRPPFASTPASSPGAAEFDAILRNLQPVIEGECIHVAH